MNPSELALGEQAAEAVPVPRNRLEEPPKTPLGQGEGTEAGLVEMARHATAAQLERVVRGYRRAISREDAQRAHEERYFTHRWDEDGCHVFEGRLSPEEGALFLGALEASRESIAEGGSAEPEPHSAGAAQGGSAEPLRLTNADALVGIAEASLAGGSGVRPAGERHQVVVHVDAQVLAREAVAMRRPASTRRPGSAAR